MLSRSVRSLLLALALLAPLQGVALFGRVLWTPDEPREADIAWRMSAQPQRVLAEFEGQPWLEKPPLSYWMSAAAIAAFGDSPAAARLPNALYTLTAAVAVFALAASMGGADMALIATLVAGSALLAWRVGTWLAPDASLMAGVAVALLGAWRGYTARRGRPKLLWYTVMHAGAAWGFMSKSAVGWAVPALALAVLIVWERRWRELARAELWAGVLLQLALLGSWIALVLGEPAGRADLRALFWNNLVGRFADVPTYGGVRYAAGHANFPGKYLIELPLYLLPWTALAVAALAQAVTASRVESDSRTAWRFAVASSLPWLALLSVAATARDLYAAPSVIGIALLVALRWETGVRAPAARDAKARSALQATLWTVVALGIGLVLAGTLLVIADDDGSGSRGTLDRAAWPIAALLAIGIALVVLVARLAATRWRGPASRSGRSDLLIGYGAYAFIVSAWGLAFFPMIDAWQDLSQVAARISREVGPHPLALLAPDETTIAMMDHGFGRAVVVQPTGTDTFAFAAAAGRWFALRGPDARLLVKLPGSAPGAVTRWIAAQTGRRLWSEDDGAAAALERAGVGRIVARYALPQGRRFALLGPAGPRAAVPPPSGHAPQS